MENISPDDLSWRELCRQASEEQDSDKLIDLVSRLNRALEDQRGKADEDTTQQGQQYSLP